MAKAKGVKRKRKESVDDMLPFQSLQASRLNTTVAAPGRGAIYPQASASNCEEVCANRPSKYSYDACVRLCRMSS